jgi:hypothetical protein
VSLFDHNSFRDLAERRGIRPRRYEAIFDSLVAMDAVTAIEETGDEILNRGKRGGMSRDAAESLLQRLLTCYTAPSEHLYELARLQRELRRHDE